MSEKSNEPFPPVLDFSSALYLGLQHPSWTLQPWPGLTAGVPAALREVPGTQQAAAALARLIGCEEALLAPSTLHLAWDLFGWLARKRITILMDAGVYPIARWGVERAVCRGVPVRAFPHHDTRALCRLVRDTARHRRRPVVVTDGFCPGCGRFAPLRQYLTAARSHGGCLVLDDTQALGVFGERASLDSPYGTGGGGSLRRHDLAGGDVLVFASLAKAFGVPIAAVAGSGSLLRSFEAASETRVHCSPPSVAVVEAARQALAINQRQGDARRAVLASRVQQFRQLAGSSILGTAGVFPVQPLAPVPGTDALAVHTRLLDLGVRTVLHRGHNGQATRVSFLLTAGHRPGQIAAAVEQLNTATKCQRTQTTKERNMDHEQPVYL